MGIASVLSTLLIFRTHKPTDSMLRRYCLLESTPDVKIVFLSGFSTVPNHTCVDGGRHLSFYSFTHHDLVQFKASFIEEVKNSIWAYASAPDFIYLHSLKTPFDFAWVFEQDVGWQGNLLSFVEHYRLWPVDFIASKFAVRHSYEWMMAEKFIGDAFVPNAPRPMCDAFVMRYSKRFADTIARDYLKKGFIADVEWFTSSVCTSLTEYNCTQLDMLRTTPYILGHPYYADFQPPMSTWSVDEHASPMQIYHPIKA